MPLRSTQICSKQFFPLASLLLAVVFAPTTWADDQVDIEFRVFSIDRQPIRGLLYLNPDNEYEELKFRARRRSDPYTYQGPPRMDFYREAGVNEEGEIIYGVVASVYLDEANRQPLIFFLADNRNNNGGRPNFRTLVMDDSPAAFPNGYLKILNACGANLIGQIGDQRLELGFGLSPSWPLSRLSTGRRGYVDIALAVRIRDDYELVFRNNVDFSENVRSIIILRPPRRSNSIQINTYLLEETISPEQS